MMKRSVKILLGLVLIPFCLGFTWQLGATVFSASYRPGAPYYFLAGGLSYLALHLLFKKPIFTYVIGHELTHAFFAVLSGGAVKSLQASDRGGRVTVTKSNFSPTESRSHPEPGPRRSIPWFFAAAQHSLSIWC